MVLNLPLFYHMKKYIISVSAGFLVLTLAYIISGFILNNNDNEEKLVSESAKLVSVIKVKNSLNSIQLPVDGRLKSKNRIKLYSEVQGLINFNQNIFAEGNSFLKKELIISINSNEFHSTVKQARSELQNLVASILPDIKIDFSNNFNH